MKKTIALLLSLILLASVLAGCGGGNTPAASGSGSAPAAGSGSAAAEGEVKNVAIICDPVGVNPFLTQVVDKFEEVKEAGTYAMNYAVIECADDIAWGENIRASVEEGYDMILCVGWQGADPLAEVAGQFPDKAEYAIIDTVCDSPHVKSYIFRPQEGAYLIGVIAAMVSADAGKPAGPFGGVHANPGMGSWEWRFGYMEGVRSVNPDVTMDNFMFNYTNSYTDAQTAKELALQQAAAGCVFINAASAVADQGTFQAAAEQGFYTSGQDSDQTDPENPNIITTQVKYTGIVAGMAIDEFFTSGVLEPGTVELGLADGVVGATYITDDGVNPRNTDILTDEIVEAARAAADAITAGEITLVLPEEESYTF